MKFAKVPAVWDGDLASVHGISAERIREASQKAREAFWASIGESFPEVTGGEMAPGEDVTLEWAANNVVSLWLMWNAGQEEK